MPGRSHGRSLASRSARVPLGLLAAGGILLLQAISVGARTWRVEKDGSGDYTVIQAAVAAAASGDTIRLGPGRWTEHQFVADVDGGQEVYVHLTVSPLTIIGAGRDLSIIGPATPINPRTEHPHGVVSQVEGVCLTVEDLRVENVDSGIFLARSDILVRRCGFRNCRTCVGLILQNRVGLIEDCRFFECPYDGGLSVWGPGARIAVSRCEFEQIGIGVNLTTARGSLRDCRFLGGAVGAQYCLGSSGDVSRCHFGEDVTNVALYLMDLSTVSLVDNLVLGGFNKVLMGSGARVSAWGNVFAGARGATIENYGCLPDFHGNHILHGTGPTILLHGFPDAFHWVDMSGNYWGTASRDSLNAWIVDGRDDYRVHAFIDFEPFSPTPLGAERRTWGGLKSLYGGARR